MIKDCNLLEHTFFNFHATDEDVRNGYTLYAPFNMKGMVGNITFHQMSPDDNVTITINLDILQITEEEVMIETFKWAIQSFPVVYDTKDLCHHNYLGGRSDIALNQTSQLATQIWARPDSYSRSDFQYPSFLSFLSPNFFSIFKINVREKKCFIFVFQNDLKCSKSEILLSMWFQICVTSWDCCYYYYCPFHS